MGKSALPVPRYAWFPPFRCRSAVGGQPISVLVTSSLCIRKDVSSISVLARNGNGSYGTEERQRNGGNYSISLPMICATAENAIARALWKWELQLQTLHYKFIQV